MAFHVNCLLADTLHEISSLILFLKATHLENVPANVSVVL